MPQAIATTCRYPGCAARATGTYCPAHAHAPKPKPSARPRATAYARGYDRTWNNLRRWHLRHHPLCEHCLASGRYTAGTEIDHILPIAQRPDLRLEPTNLQTLCRRCHSRKTIHDARTQTNTHRP